MGCGKKACYDDDIAEYHSKKLDKLKLKNPNEFLDDIERIQGNFYQFYKTFETGTKFQFRLLDELKKDIEGLTK